MQRPAMNYEFALCGAAGGKGVDTTVQVTATDLEDLRTNLSTALGLRGFAQLQFFDDTFQELVLVETLEEVPTKGRAHIDRQQRQIINLFALHQRCESSHVTDVPPKKIFQDGKLLLDVPHTFDAEILRLALEDKLQVSGDVQLQYYDADFQELVLLEELESLPWVSRIDVQSNRGDMSHYLNVYPCNEDHDPSEPFPEVSPPILQRRGCNKLGNIRLHLEDGNGKVNVFSATVLEYGRVKSVGGTEYDNVLYFDKHSRRRVRKVKALERDWEKLDFSELLRLAVERGIECRGVPSREELVDCIKHLDSERERQPTPKIKERPPGRPPRDLLPVMPSTPMPSPDAGENSTNHC